MIDVTSDPSIDINSDTDWPIHLFCQNISGIPKKSQVEVFQPVPKEMRKIVLATNIAGEYLVLMVYG